MHETEYVILICTKLRPSEIFCSITLHFDFLLALPNTVPNTATVACLTGQISFICVSRHGLVPGLFSVVWTVLYVACFAEKIKKFVHAYHIHMPTQMLCSCSLKWSLGVLVG